MQRTQWRPLKKRPLTRQQRRALGLWLRHRNTTEVARRMGLGRSTVRKYLAAALRKKRPLRGDPQGYSLLAEAIVAQAAEDFRGGPYRESAEEFFRGGWFGFLCDSAGVDAGAVRERLGILPERGDLT